MHTEKFVEQLLDISGQHPELLNCEELMSMVQNVDLLAQGKRLSLLAQLGCPDRGGSTAG